MSGEVAQVTTGPSSVFWPPTALMARPLVVSQISGYSDRLLVSVKSPSQSDQAYWLTPDEALDDRLS
jgi:hypothetical protein